MTYLVKQVGQHRGAPRLYFQSQQLAELGFKPGIRYTLTTARNRVYLQVDPKGPLRVSSKSDGAVPVIDINSRAALAPFEGCAAVKVVMRENEIVISKLASEEAARSRLDRLKKAVATTLTVAGLAFGAGILDHSAHAGLVQAGLQPQTVLINEIDEGLVDHARRANPVLTPTTLTITAPMQEAIQDEELMASVPRADVLVAGIPCSGASKAGKSKHGIAMMEAHPEVGHLAHAFLVFLQRTQPGVFVIENVKEYAESASAMLIRQQSRDMGYTTHEVVLDAKDFGSLESRVRWFLVGATRGVHINLEGLVPPVRQVRTVGDILDKNGDHHWGTFQYLRDKAARDKAAGKGFQMQVVDPSDTRVPTLRKGYHKGGSTDPLLQHPDDPTLLRLFSGDEHARIKGVDPKLVAGMSNTDKHIALGQGVVPGPVIALTRRIGECLRESLLTDQAFETTAGYRLDRAVG